MVKSSSYFPWYFGDIDHVETGVLESGILLNSLKTLSKLSESLRCIKALICN